MTTMTDVRTVEALLEQSREQDGHKVDFEASARLLEFDPMSRLTVTAEPALFKGANVNMSPLTLTDWSWGQVCGKLGRSVFGKGTDKALPREYMMALRPDLRAYVLNDHMRHYENGDWLVRAYDDTCRAVLTTGYSVVPNTDLLEMLGKIVTGESQPGHLASSSEVHPDGMNVRVIWKDVTRRTPDAGGNKDWGIGVYIGNGEIGNSRIRMRPLIKRGSCDNSIVGDKDFGGVDMIHRGSAVTKMVVLKAAMAEVLPFAAQLLDTMIEAEGHKIPDFADTLAGLAKLHGWDEVTALNVAAGTENQQTKAGIVNGITFAAQKVEDPDKRADMEVLGGRILCGPDTLFGRVAEMARKLQEE